MKKILMSISFGLLLGGLSQAQVIISENASPTASSPNVLLEFGTAKKGIIVPSVAEATDAVNGTFFFDTTTKEFMMVENENLVSLTENAEEGVNHAFANAGGDVGAGAIIGATSTTKPGALVLESTTQALVLPKVASPHLNMPSPIAGTMVYDTDADMLAVYDGKNWSYWK